MSNFKNGDLVEVTGKFKDGTNGIHWNPVMEGQIGFKARVGGDSYTFGVGERVNIKFLDSYTPPVGTPRGGIWTYPPECLKKLEVRKPRHPKFKVEDKVKIARKINVGLWVGAMDAAVGKEGKITELWHYPTTTGVKRGARVMVEGVGEWNYPINSLEKIK